MVPLLRHSTVGGVAEKLRPKEKLDRS